MANNIKGITIEIGGNTTKLESALKSVNKQVYSLNSDLKSLNQALKLDPKNTELLAQKQDVLKRNIQATTEKLKTLKEAQRQMGDYNKLTDEQKTSYNKLSNEIAKSENALKKMNQELKSTSKVDLTKLKDGLKKVGDVAADVTKKMLKVSAAIGAAFAGLVGAGVKSYADLEQNLGGVETLFGKSANKVVENAKKAYATAGVSANQYMEGVTSFAASLLQSLGGNTSKAADIADMAFRDMSDNANKFGTDMQSIQNAYQGFAKQNYTMLDNLKLGYGGTKTEMERLLKDAQKLTGVKYNIKNLSDVYEAIHVIQKNLKITGTTAVEAEKTISGSVGSMKAAFSNFLNGSGSPQALSESISNVLINIATSIQKLAPSLASGLSELIKNLLPLLNDLLWELLPSVLDLVSDVIDYIYKSIGKNTTQLNNSLLMIINEIVSFITNNLPKILSIGVSIILTLAKGITQSIPSLIPTIVDLIFALVDSILANLGPILDAAIGIVIALVDGLIVAIPRLIDYAPKIIEALVNALIQALPKLAALGPEIIAKLIFAIIINMPKLLELGPKIIISIIKGIISGLPNVLDTGKRIISKLIEGLKSAPQKIKEACNYVIDKIKEVFTKLPSKAFDWGKDMVKGIAKGITGAVGEVGKAAGKVASKITSFLHFSKPDEGPLREYEKWMPDFVKGLAKGINDSAYLVEDAANGLANDITNGLTGDFDITPTSRAMRQLSNGIESSVSPIINPQVNTNPLTIQIENFYNNRNSDIQSLSQELEFYRKQAAQSRGGN